MSFPFISSNPGGGEIPWPDTYATGEAVPVTPCAVFPVYSGGVWTTATVLPGYAPGTPVADQSPEGTLYPLAFDTSTNATSGWPMVVRHGWQPKEWTSDLVVDLYFYADNGPTSVSLTGLQFGLQPASPAEDLAVFPGGDYENDPLGVDPYPGGGVGSGGRAGYYYLGHIANDSGFLDTSLDGIDDVYLKYWWRFRIGRALRHLNSAIFCEVQIDFQCVLGTQISAPIPDTPILGTFSELSTSSALEALRFSSSSLWRGSYTAADQNGLATIKTGPAGTTYGSIKLCGARSGFAPTADEGMVAHLNWNFYWSSTQLGRPPF